MYIQTYRPKDALEIDLQEAQMGEIVLNKETADGLAQIGPAYTGRNSGDRIIGCFGLWMRHYGVSEAWGLVAKGVTGSDMLAITRAIGQFLDGRSEHRISTFAIHDWQPGGRWLRLLGFRYEGVMKHFTPTGQDCDLYARPGGKSWAPLLPR